MAINRRDFLRNGACALGSMALVSSIDTFSVVHALTPQSAADYRALVCVFLNGGTFLNIVQFARRKAERERSIQRVKDAIAEIDSIGVQVKDLDIGLLDFPCEVDGRTVLLCWKVGEKSITHWHGVSEGYAGRKPIDERIAKAKRSH